MPGNWSESLDHRGSHGLLVTRRLGAVAVESVRPGSSAATEGVKQGDLILAIEGRDVRGLGPGAVQFLLSRKPGEMVSVTLQSPGGEARTVRLTAARVP